jgi:predicted nucleotidyltransferase
MKFGLSDKVIEEIQDVFRRHIEVEKVLIFGSRAKGNYRAGSDIDLAVIGNNIDYRLILKIGCEIDSLELLYGIDLLDYQSKKNTPIGEHIDRVGQIFYERLGKYFVSQIN